MVEVASPRTPSRGRRRLLWGALLAIVVVGVVAVLALPRLVDVERFRGRIEQALSEATGWDPELGRIRLSVLRGLTLEVAPASLVAPDADSRIEVGALSVVAELRPLLRGRLEVRSVVLEDPQLRIVRPDLERGWVVPWPAGGGGAGAASPDASTGAGRVSIDTIRLRNGRLHLEDRAANPVMTLELSEIDLTVVPAELTLSASALLNGGQGRFGLEGAADGPLRLTLKDVATDLLVPFVGEDVLRPGGRLDGTIDLRLPTEIEGDLQGRGLQVLAGERPVESADIRFLLRAEDGQWRLKPLTLETGGVQIRGEGSVAPLLSLTFEIPETPLAPALELARSAFPLPLELRSPGTAQATILVEADPDGEIRYEATGRISAAGFQAAEFLPEATNLQSRFELSRAGALVVHLLEGAVAGGPLRGTVRLDSIDGPAPIRFDGNLIDAAFGTLLDGFVDRAGERIGGPAGLDARVTLDLDREPLDARALGGTLALTARKLTLPGWDLEAAITERVREKLGALAEVAGGLDGKLADKLGLGRDDDAEAAATGAVATVRELLESLSAEVDFNQIPWSLQRFRIEAGGMAADGAGRFDPLTGEVDLRVAASFDEARTVELVARYPEIKILVGQDRRLAVPLSIQGPMVGPRIRADLDRVTRNKVGAEEPKEAVKGLLKDLLKRKLDERDKPE